MGCLPVSTNPIEKRAKVLAKKGGGGGGIRGKIVMGPRLLIPNLPEGLFTLCEDLMKG